MGLDHDTSGHSIAKGGHMHCYNTGDGNLCFFVSVCVSLVLLFKVETRGIMSKFCYPTD